MDLTAQNAANRSGRGREDRHLKFYARRDNLIMRRGYGFQSPWSVIALAMLSLGGLCPPLPAEGA